MFTKDLVVKYYQARGGTEPLKIGAKDHQIWW